MCLAIIHVVIIAGPRGSKLPAIAGVAAPISIIQAAKVGALISAGALSK